MSAQVPVLDRRQPFTRTQAREAGLTWRYLNGPRCQTLLRGVYLDAAVPPTPALLARAALMVVPGAVAACHLTAAAILELPVPMSDDIHVLVPAGGPRVRRDGVRVHRGSRRLSQRGGVVLTRAVDTFVDVAADVPLVEAVVMGDVLVRKGYATVAALQRAAAAASGTRAWRVRRAAAWVRPRVLSPPETRLRLLLMFSGLPEPVAGHRLLIDGRERELDAAYPRWKVGVEYDGRHHVERDLQWSEDIERREQLEAERWRLVTVTGLQMRDPARVLDRVRHALHARGAPLPPLNEQWRRYIEPARERRSR